MLDPRFRMAMDTANQPATEDLTVRWQRRLVSLTLLAVGWHGLTATLPLLAILSLLAGLMRPAPPGRLTWVHLRLLALAWSLATAELAGVLAAAWLWIAHRGEPNAVWMAHHYRLQARWASALFGIARRLLGLQLRVEGAEVAAAGPQLMLVRHVSQLDTLIPVALLSGPFGTRLRYVMKRELLWDPCLDVVGQRLPNAFIAREKGARARELEALARLAQGLGALDGVLLFPEGTRFSAQRRMAAIGRLHDRPDTQERARQLRYLLPPRPAGVLALLEAAPDADVVLCGHAGLDGLRKMADLMSWPAEGRTLHLRFWRFARATVPQQREAQIDWLWTRWEELDAWVASVQQAQ